MALAVGPSVVVLPKVLLPKTLALKNGRIDAPRGQIVVCSWLTYRVMIWGWVRRSWKVP